MDKIIKPGLILCIICVAAAAILGFAYNATLEPIAIQAEKTKADAMKEVLPEADSFEDLALTDETLGITEVFAAKKGEEIIGFAVFGYTMEGYSGEVDILTGIDTTGTITGISIIAASETPGLGDNAKKPEFKNQYVGKTGPLEVVKIQATGENDIVAMTSATITTKAVTNAVNSALEFYQANLVEVK